MILLSYDVSKTNKRVKCLIRKLRCKPINILVFKAYLVWLNRISAFDRPEMAVTNTVTVQCKCNRCHSPPSLTINFEVG